MSVLFLMRNWDLPSELFMQRMIEMLEPHLTAVGAVNPDEATWRGRVPALKLGREKFTSLLKRQLFLKRKAKQTTRDAHRIVAQTIKSRGVKSVLCHFLSFAIELKPAWNACDIPLYVHCHGQDVTWDLRRSDNPNKCMHPPDYQDEVRKLSQRATIIANSETTRQRLLAIGVEESRIVVKYLGVPVPLDEPPQTDATDGCNILFLGRLVDCKGPDLVIKAFEQAAERGLNGRLIMAGDGPMRPQCEQLRNNSVYKDRISMLGAVSPAEGQRLRENATIFTAHNCFGAVSRQEEAFGVSVVEAMAAGLPVVSGRSGGLIETVVDGETGYLIDPLSIQQHADALLRLAGDASLRRRLGIAGWKRALSCFSVEREKQALLKILNLPATAASCAETHRKSA